MTIELRAMRPKHVFLLFVVFMLTGFVVYTAAQKYYRVKENTQPVAQQDPGADKEKEIAESLDRLSKMASDPKMNPNGPPTQEEIQVSLDKLSKNTSPASPEEIQASLDTLSNVK